MSPDPVFPPCVSLVIPVYNEESRLPATLRAAVQFATRQAFTMEIIICDDGSTDGTVAWVRDFARQHLSVHLIIAPHLGKGHGVKLGLLAARGDHVFFCDADLSVPLDYIPAFLKRQGRAIDIMIGSRSARGALRFGEPAHRWCLSRCFNALVQWVFVRDIADTQCGFKYFRRDVARVLAARQTTHGFAFDIELLVIARRCGYTITEAAVFWWYGSKSRIRIWRDSLRVAPELFQIWRNVVSGRYD